MLKVYIQKTGGVVVQAARRQELLENCYEVVRSHGLVFTKQLIIC